MKPLSIALFLLLAVADAHSAPVSDFPESEVQKLIDAGGNEFPKTLERLHDLSERMGPITETIIPFSDTPFFTSLYEPRIVVSLSPKLYYSAIPRLDGTSDMEFISWNNRSKTFDFGKIVDFGTDSPKFQKVDEKACFACHQNRGPLFSDRPWLNVNGANAPIGTYLSFALLTVMMEQEPHKYERFQEILDMKARAYNEGFGNLAPEPAIALGPVRFHGTPVFHLRGSFDLDANTRRGHYLALTFQILHELPPAVGREFVRTMVEEGLAGMVYPERIDRLFSWNEYLDGWIEKYPNLRNLPAMTSPVIENYQPLFDNPKLLEEAGIAQREVDTDPVSALVKLGKFVHTNQIRAYPPERLPSSGNAFIELKPNHNGGADTALALTCDMTKSDAKKIRTMLNERLLELDDVFATSAWTNLWQKAQYPEREVLLTAIAQGTGSNAGDLVKSDRRKPIQPTPKAKSTHALQLSVAEMASHTCLACHNDGPDGMAKAFPFDPARLDAWESYLGDPATRSMAQRWINGTYERLRDRKMPPEDSDQAKRFSLEQPQWSAIYEFLKRNATPE